jgi:C4-dicarboxylate-specific signal transduction histidine kinase
MELAHTNRITATGQMAASIAHEVSQPISAALTNANAARYWLGAEPPDLEEARQALDRMIRDGGRAEDVFGRIRSKLDAMVGTLCASVACPSRHETA